MVFLVSYILEIEEGKEKYICGNNWNTSSNCLKLHPSGFIVILDSRQDKLEPCGIPQEMPKRSSYFFSKGNFWSFPKNVRAMSSQESSLHTYLF